MRECIPVSKIMSYNVKPASLLNLLRYSTHWVLQTALKCVFCILSFLTELLA